MKTTTAMTQTALTHMHVELERRAARIRKTAGIRVTIGRNGGQFLVSGDGWRVGPYPAQDMDDVMLGIEQSAGFIATYGRKP